jgi:hypothetical protein
MKGWPVVLGVIAALGFLVAASTATATTRSTPICGITQLNTKAHPCKPQGVRCPVLSATGVLGTSTNVAGGIPETSGAYGGLTLDCTAVADGMQLKAPGHTFMLVHPTTSLDRCGVSGDTITCKLNVPQEKLGLGYVGAWQNAINWRFSPSDSASHDVKYGSCDIPVTITMTNGNAVAFSKGTTTVCMFAAGDVLK